MFFKVSSTGNQPLSLTEKIRRYFKTIGLRIYISHITHNIDHVLFIGCAILVGFAAVAFSNAAAQAQEMFTIISDHLGLGLLLLTPVVFAFSAWMTKRYFNGAEGSGIPQAIATYQNYNKYLRGHLFSGRVVIGKVFLTLVCLLAGAAIGREGPTVQVGVAIMCAVARFIDVERQRGFVLAGAAAGLAAAFNTPIAGVVFAIEELGKSFTQKLSGIIIVAVVVSGMVSLTLVGDHSYLGHVYTSIFHLKDWTAVLVCGLVCGFAGACFARLVVEFIVGEVSFIRKARQNPLLFAAGCGVIVAAMALLTHNFAAGSSYAETKSLLQGTQTFPWWYSISKLVSTVCSSIAGIPGGLFSPSLAVGANLGHSLSAVLGSVDIRTLTLFGMAAYFSGVSQAPFTAFMIVMEMTENNEMVLPLMATSIIAALISRMVQKKPLYHAIAEHYLTPQAIAAE